MNKSIYFIVLVLNLLNKMKIHLNKTVYFYCKRNIVLIKLSIYL